MTGDGKALALSENLPAGPMREVARYALSPEWTMTGALSLLPPAGGRQLGATASRYEEELRPLKAAEPNLDGSLARSVADAFAPIGAKMRPDMSQEQAMFWASALVKAFADLPPFIVRAALDEAVHIPFAFPTDMEAKVREIAERRLSAHRTAIRRLHSMLDEIHRAANPAPQLESAPDEPMDREEVRALRKTSLGADLIRMGLASGAIRQDDLDAIEAEEAEDERTAPRDPPAR